MDRAKESYEQAIALDPEFALAHVGYADYLMLAGSTWASARQLTLAREEVKKALDLDPALPEANAWIGVIAGNCDYDWKEAERRFRLALAQEPVPPQARTWYAFHYLLPMGRLEEAIGEHQRALQQDPLNVLLRHNYACCLAAAGRLLESESEHRQVLEIDPRLYLSRPFGLPACTSRRARRSPGTDRGCLRNVAHQSDCGGRAGGIAQAQRAA